MAWGWGKGQRHMLYLHLPEKKDHGAPKTKMPTQDRSWEGSGQAVTSIGVRRTGFRVRQAWVRVLAV